MVSSIEKIGFDFECIDLAAAQAWKLLGHPIHEL